MPVSSVSLAQRKQTYTNMLYLITTLPVGIISFVAVVLGIVLGLISPIVLVITPITALCFVLIWQLATFERFLVIKWLHVDVPAMSTPSALPDRRWWQRIQAHLSNPVAWKSLLYLFLLFPFGIFAFNIVISFSALMLALGTVLFVLSLVASPFFYLAYALRDSGRSRITVKGYLLRAVTCYGVIALPFYLFNGMAWLWGQFARTMLGMSDKDRRLLEARALAEQERARAEEADRKRRDLIINVSHELRTPVASIRGHIESLQAACVEGNGAGPSPATLSKYLGIVQREAVRLGVLVEDLLSLARTETNELRLDLAPVEAGEIVEEVYQTLMPLARRERQIVLVRNIVPCLPRVMADRQRLTQVLLNLVRNAITYTPDGGIVSIQLQWAADPQYLALVVSDTGIGIAPEDQDRIFERFYRTDASRTRSSGGFGLGLAIVRDFVVAMGGSISVASALGEGSSFCVLLLVAPPQGQHQPSQVDKTQGRYGISSSSRP